MARKTVKLPEQYRETFDFYLRAFSPTGHGGA
jgi:hypothetical protein